MKIVGLLENTTCSSDVKSKHGLSLYIETKNHKILFDTGPNELFSKNAEALGVSLDEVDTVAVSHGHVDHCGGLKYFLEKNKKAKIYIRPQAVEKHYVKVLGLLFYAGIDRTLASCDRFVFTEDFLELDDEVTLFSNVFGDFPLPKSDENLFVKRDGRIVRDDFSHEQNLLLNVGEKRVLICGCAHAGIVNIVKKAKALTGEYPTEVVGGFHLFEPTTRRCESDGYIESVAAELEKSEASYYTCHCTGEKVFEKMKPLLGERLTYLHTGSFVFL